jgi:hypothetical protein
LQEGQAGTGANPLVAKLHTESKKRWGKTYAALAK